MTEKEFLDIVDLYQGPVNISSRSDIKSAKEQTLYKIESKSEIYRLRHFPNCKQSTTYYIKFFQAGPVKLESVYLIFYQNKLIDIELKGTRVVTEAIRTKYPRIDLSQNFFQSRCDSFIYGDKSDVVIYETFRNDSVVCGIDYKTLLMKNCIPYSMTNISLYDKKKFIDLRICNLDGQQALDGRIKDQKLQELEDF